MKEQVQLDGLLFSSDAHVLAIMPPILGSFAIETQVCNEISSALDVVAQRRLDTVVVDWDEDFDPSVIVRSARKSSPNSNATIVAIVSSKSETHALLVGANFMIHKPTNTDHARRCMRAAYGTMLQNRRRAARVSVNVQALTRITELGEVEARITDLSVGGFALQCSHRLTINSDVMARFSLPGDSKILHVAGKVANSNGSGRAGIRFCFVPDGDRNLLEAWLAIELAKLEKAEMPMDDVVINATSA
jgi:DNA-binding response OmpR family regulator